jgi:hypothetical protein
VSQLLPKLPRVRPGATAYATLRRTSNRRAQCLSVTAGSARSVAHALISKSTTSVIAAAENDDLPR